MVKQARNRVSSDFPISVKIRLDKDPKCAHFLHPTISLSAYNVVYFRNTTQLVQTAIHAGASYIGVHGRTRHQKDTEPASWDGIKFAREEAKGAVPVIGNGDIFTLQDSIRMKEGTGVNAAMSARGLLENPVSIVIPNISVQRRFELTCQTGSFCGLRPDSRPSCRCKYLGPDVDSVYGQCN